jgi:hypothetical protein
MRRRSHKRREMDVEYEEKKASLSLTQVSKQASSLPATLSFFFIIKKGF